MLQIRTFFFICIFILAALGASAQDPEWLLKNAFEKEQISLDDADIVLPEELQQALKNYNEGNYRYAAEILQRVRALNLPDGQLDFIAFALGECYRQLRLQQRASEQYKFVARVYPSSDKVPPSLFRLMEYAVNDGDMEVVDSIFILFQNRYRSHPLYNNLLYISGVIYFKNHNLEESLDLLSKVDKRSSRYPYAQFVSGLCYITKNELDKALMSFDYVKNNSRDPDLSTEATILIGDVYYTRNNIPVALQFYQRVSRDSKRYQYSVVKTVRAYLDMGKFEEARDQARKFLSKYKDTEFFFEMASILEQAYTKLENDKAAANLSSLIYRQVIDSRIVFEIFEEIDRLTDMAKTWQTLEYEAIRKQNESLRLEAQNNTLKIRDLEKKLRTLLFQIDPSKQNVSGEKTEIRNQAERRYLNLLKNKIRIYEDSILVKRGELELKTALAQKTIQDTILPKIVDSITVELHRLQSEHTKIEQEHALVIKECFGNDYEGRNTDEQTQAKFVDWAFMKYQDKKEELKSMALEIAEFKKGKNPETDSLKHKGKEVIRIFTELDRDKLKSNMADDRTRLINHIGTMLEVYPSNRYNPQILFRVAELHYDAAGDEFQSKLREYERKMAEGSDTSGLVFPDYNLENVIRVYDQIIQQYPKSSVADDAFYYKALALQKQGMEDDANNTFMELVKKYPDSEYYVEANMNIGHYYFDHPRINNGKGYDLAQDAYRKVLYYRDHPQFTQALYHLGWCYYMEDKYDEAIAVFKYLIEEVELDFDPNRMEEKQVVNPLLRGEAIDYIAISFDEENRVEDAVKFLKLVGNVDYSAMVLKRIGELREEDLDFKTAINIYKILLDEYPVSTAAPDVTVNLIKLYESRSLPDSANLMREKFFREFYSGSQWQNAVSKKDSALVSRVDSMAISIGMYVADAAYRRAEISKNGDDYSLAAKKYGKIIEKYPNHQRAADAQWNMAVILDTKLNDKPLAYNQYLKFSNLLQLDSTKREQAALNAIAIAQSLLPPDSSVQKGNVDFAAAKVVEAADNYQGSVSRR